jgi:hypothetical protein
MRRGAVERALGFILDRIEDDPTLAAGPKRGYDVRGWGHAYGLRLLLALTEAKAVPDPQAARVKAAIPHLIECLMVNAQKTGGWNYAGERSASPFMTGSTLLTLFEARAQGHGVDPEVIERALDALERGRAENGAFAYSGDAGRSVAMPGSAARSAVAELALHLAGRSEPARLRGAVLGFFEGWEDLLARKSKQGTHKGEFGIAPYYFFFGHAYVAAAIEALPEGEQRLELRQRLQGLIWSTRESDGSWNDRVFPRTGSYGTAMVVLALTAPHSKGWRTWVR